MLKGVWITRVLYSPWGVPSIHLADIGEPQRESILSNYSAFYTVSLCVQIFWSKGYTKILQEMLIISQM